MSARLAVVSPRVGALSETFIRRHMEDVLPGDTVIVAGTREHDGGWGLTVPALVLDREGSGLVSRARREVMRRLGWPVGDPRSVAVTRFLTSHGVEVVLGEYLDASLPWFDVAQSLGLRFFVHAHGYDVSRSLRDPRWRAAYGKYRDADGVITVSAWSKARLVALGLPASRIHVVACGVHVNGEWVERPEEETIRCLAVGRMVAKKAPVFLLDAFRRALAQEPRLRLDMVGSGPLFPAACQCVRAFGLESHVTLHGARPNEVVQAMMKEADLFIQHSVTDANGDEEGLPVAILEAMAHGLPVVSTRHAGIPEAVEDGVTGLLVAEEDSSGMSERISLLALHPATRYAFGRAGWQRARERFSAQQEQAQLRVIMGLSLSS